MNLRVSLSPMLFLAFKPVKNAIDFTLSKGVRRQTRSRPLSEARQTILMEKIMPFLKGF